MIKSHEAQLQICYEEDVMYEAALDYRRMEAAAIMLDVELGVPVRATGETALIIYKYARQHQPELYEFDYDDDTIRAAQQERAVQY